MSSTRNKLESLEPAVAARPPAGDAVQGGAAAGGPGDRGGGGAGLEPGGAGHRHRAAVCTDRGGGGAEARGAGAAVELHPQQGGGVPGQLPHPLPANARPAVRGDVREAVQDGGEPGGGERDGGALLPGKQHNDGVVVN